jgi:2-oxoglutarate ferredoxin oxidoreductase subunit delta
MENGHGAGPEERAERPEVPPVSIKREWCKSCGICIEFCPKKVFDTDDEGRPVVSRPEECGSCQICEQLCPDFAITVRREKRARKK